MQTKASPTQDARLKVLVAEPVPDPSRLQDLFAGLDVDLRVSALDQAPDQVNQEKFDGIFIDMGTERGRSGLMEDVRASSWNRTTPIVAMAEKGCTHTVADAFRRGASFYLVKPLDRTRLRLLLNSARGAMLENRRLVERAPLHVAVRCQLGEVSALVKTHNISARGALLSGAIPWQVSDTLHLTFHLPNQWTQIATRALVVRVDEQGRAGVSFCGLRLNDRQRIKIAVAEALYGLPDVRGKSQKAV